MRFFSVNDRLRDNIYKLNESDVFNFINELDEAKKDIYLQLIISDALKILTVKNTKAAAYFSSTKQLYDFLKDADMDEMKFYIEDNSEFFIYLYYQGKSFYDMPIIDRCLMMRSLLENIRTKPLVNIDTPFLLDGMIYTLRKDIEVINDYYIDYIEKNGADSLDSFYLIIRSLLEELRIEDKEMFEENLMDMIRKFYISYKYTEKFSSVQIENGAIPKNLLEKEEIHKAKMIIYSLPELFSEVLSFYFSYMNDNDLFNKKEVDEFCQKSISLEMKRKLHIL